MLKPPQLKTKWFAIRSFPGYPLIVRIGSHERRHFQWSIVSPRKAAP